MAAAAQPTLVHVFDFNFKSSEPLGQKIVDRREDDEEDKAEDAQEDRSEHIQKSNFLYHRVAEDHHPNPDGNVNETYQDLESGHDLAGLQDGDADQLLFHSWWFVGDGRSNRGLTFGQSIRHAANDKVDLAGDMTRRHHQHTVAELKRISLNSSVSPNTV